MRYITERSTVQVLGGIWWPMGQICAMERNLSSYDLENAKDDNGEWTRESVARWIDTHMGDFSSIVDFRADFSSGGVDFVSEWAHDESEFTWTDCTYPDND